MEGNNNYRSAAGWFLVGGVAGACTALLLAPAPGKRTRDRLARTFRETKESVADFTTDVADTTRHIAEKAGRVGHDAMRLAGDASAAARDVVGSLGVHTARVAKRL